MKPSQRIEELAKNYGRRDKLGEFEGVMYSDMERIKGIIDFLDEEWDKSEEWRKRFSLDFLKENK